MQWRKTAEDLAMRVGDPCELMAFNAWRHLQLAILSAKASMMVDDALTGFEVRELDRLANDLEDRIRGRLGCSSGT